MPLTIVSVAYPFSPVAPETAGGAEQVLGMVDAALVAQGHRSIVIAQEGSRVKGLLLSTAVPRSTITDNVRKWVLYRHQANVERALATFPADLIHLHGIDFAELRLPAHIPKLVTLHLPLSWYPKKIWSENNGNSAAGGYDLQCVSYSQRAAGPKQAIALPVIENGVVLPAWWNGIKKQQYALVLSRICPEKNVHTALDAGTEAGIPVFIGGATFPYPEHHRYFHEQVESRLTGGHRFLGALGPRHKQRLLREASCVLIPSLAPETSSLVAIEALAAGTAVIAFASGALPEIIDDGVTGFLVSNMREMAQAIRNAHKIRPEICRAVAERRFSAVRMIADYMRLYKQLAGNAVSGPNHRHA